MAKAFYFAWVDSDQTEFDPATMNVEDEHVLGFVTKHDEGQIPTLEIKMKNPRVGLLSPGRKVWAWLSYQAPSGIVPIFFGVLVGVPANMFAEQVSLSFIAKSLNFIEDKQALAETMKTRPFYDPIFLDERHRDEPDSILEGWSSLWHVDRTSLEITASDILVGEDGTINFNEGDALYDSVSMTLGESPLTDIRVEATVNWSQNTSGFVTIPPLYISSYTGDSVLSDWPKAGAGIGGGWRVETSFVTDTYHIAQTPQTHSSSSWENKDHAPLQCTEQSSSESSEWPALLSPDPIVATMTEVFTTGVCDPGASPPVNRPVSIHTTGIVIPLWNLSCSMVLRYDAQRQFQELLTFDMKADTQGILASPTVQQDSELLTISSVDVGKAMLEVDAWSDFAEAAVALGQIVFANDPTTPGGLAYQICVVAGIAGDVEPRFSDIPGVTTADGTVTWSSMGTSPLTTQPDWSPASFVPLGEIICYQETTLNIAHGTFENVPGATTYYICTRAGRTNTTYHQTSYVPPVQSNDEAIPAPIIIDRINPPSFTTIPGAQIADGSVIWTCLGQSPAMLGIPIGGTPGNVTARSYFPTDRGLWSVEYLIAKARARLRMRSRCVKLTWDCPFELALGMSCRHNATLHDPRLPGSVATGKVTSYSLMCDGDTGKLLGHIEIGCAIGFGNSVTAVTGTPEYTAASGYMQAGYQQYDGAMPALPTEDIRYTRPDFGGGFDDGLHFPLSAGQVSDGGVISGNIADQRAAIEAAIPATRTLANLGSGPVISSTPNGSSTSTSLSPDSAWIIEQAQVVLASQAIPYVMAAHPISWQLLLKPVTGSFDGAYSIEVSPLAIPQGINLESPSSP